MNKTIKHIVITIILTFFHILGSYGQENKIHVVARAFPNKILLRWSPPSAIAWYYLNQYGYRIERYTIYQNDNLIQDPMSTHRVLSDKILPWNKQSFVNVIDTNNYLAIVAQSIYGESFEVEASHLSRQLLNKADELQNRFSFCLLASGISLVAAKAAGLFLCDTNVRPDERYLYRIISLVPDTIEKIDTGFIYTGSFYAQPLPKPILISVEAEGSKAIIKWDRLHFEQTYLYYIVERSSDGVHFEVVNSNPYISTSEELGNQLYYQRIDSIPVKNKKFYYRIRGVTLFEEISPPSDTLSVIAQNDELPLPSISYAKVVNQTILLKWDYPAIYRSQTKRFEIYRGNSRENILPLKSDRPISAYDSVFIDQSPATTNYYQVVAIDSQEQKYASLPYLVMLEDSIPPLPPINLQGSIDTLGRVFITWSNNTESDLAGYMVYRANYSNEEFIQVSSDIISDTVFVDSINIMNLTSTICYKIKALDKYFNPSDFSAILTLRKPDKVSPQPPALYGYQISNGVASVRFAPSSSNDVKRYVTYRKMGNDSLWTACAVLQPADTLFTDTCYLAPCYNTYRIIAIDSAGNESYAWQELKIIITEPHAKLEVNPNLYAIKDVERKTVTLNWDSLPAGAQYTLIRSENNENHRRLLTFRQDVKQYSDKNLVPGKTYEYEIISRQVKLVGHNKVIVQF